MKNKNVYLLYVGDEWLGKNSLTLIGVYSNKTMAMKDAAKDFAYDFHNMRHWSADNWDFEEDPDPHPHVVRAECYRSILAELKENGQTQGHCINYTIYETPLNQMDCYGLV